MKIDIFIGNEKKPPPRYLAPKLAGLLSTIQELEQLVLVIPEFHTAPFEASLTNLMFPHVRSLVVGPYCDFAAKLCPNLQTFSSNGWHFKEAHRDGYQNHTMRLIREAAVVPNLTRFEINAYWDSENLGGKIQVVGQAYSFLC